MALEFPDLGQHCGVKDCGKLDFLPFSCNACPQVFCLEHRSYEQHNCKAGLSRDNQAFFCSECNASINIGYGGDVDEKWALHLMNDCAALNNNNTNNSSSRKRQTKPRITCIVKGCKAASYCISTCKSCQQRVCISHRFGKDHRCASFQVDSSAQVCH